MSKKDYNEMMEKYKAEAAKEIGVDLSAEKKGHLSAKQAGSIGGRMVKKMIADYEKILKGWRALQPFKFCIIKHSYDLV